MNQERLRDVAIIAIERDITIHILENKLDELVDAFGEARDCSSEIFSLFSSLF